MNELKRIMEEKLKQEIQYWVSKGGKPFSTREKLLFNKGFVCGVETGRTGWR